MTLEGSITYAEIARSALADMPARDRAELMVELLCQLHGTQAERLLQDAIVALTARRFELLELAGAHDRTVALARLGGGADPEGARS